MRKDRRPSVNQLLKVLDRKLEKRFKKLPKAEQSKLIAQLEKIKFNF